MKYIRYRKCGIVLFSNIIRHKNMALHFNNGDKIISAGFVGIDLEGNLDCYGASASLEISSLEEDSEILREQF